MLACLEVAEGIDTGAEGTSNCQYEPKCFDSHSIDDAHDYARSGESDYNEQKDDWGSLMRCELAEKSNRRQENGKLKRSTMRIRLSHPYYRFLICVNQPMKVPCYHNSLQSKEFGFAGAVKHVALMSHRHVSQNAGFTEAGTMLEGKTYSNIY